MEAIAELVQRGSVKVILTTNFDKLVEQALTAAGVGFQVVDTPSGITGMQPLTHARCTVIKLHGDYTRIDQLNTVEELSSYPPALVELLHRVLDEYGLVINGWSGDWDHALAQASCGHSTSPLPDVVGVLRSGWVRPRSGLWISTKRWSSKGAMLRPTPSSQISSAGLGRWT